MPQHAETDCDPTIGDWGITLTMYSPAFGHLNLCVSAGRLLAVPSKDIPRNALPSDAAAVECLITRVHMDRHHPAGRDSPTKNASYRDAGVGYRQSLAHTDRGSRIHTDMPREDPMGPLMAIPCSIPTRHWQMLPVEALRS